MVVTPLLLEQMKSFVLWNNIHSCLSVYLTAPLKPASSQELHINEAGVNLNEGQYRLIFSLIHHLLKRLQIWRKSSCVVLLYFQSSSRVKAFSVRGLSMQNEAKQVGLTEQLSWLAQTESKQQGTKLGRDFVGLDTMVTLILFLDYVNLHIKERGHKICLAGHLLFIGNRQNQHNMLK